MKNAARHERWSISQPPNTGPSAAISADAPDHVPMALPRLCSSNDALMIAKLPGTSNAAPTPWIARAAMSWRTLPARPHHTDAVANSATPITNTRRRPNRSPAAPPTSNSAARNNAYDSTTHCTSTRFAESSRCNAGSATFTTVPSMNAMLEAMIVAARIHGEALGAEGDKQGAPRMMPASQGEAANVIIPDRPFARCDCSSQEAYRNPAGIAHRSPIRNAPSINSASTAAGTAPASNIALSLSASPVTMRSPYPPAPMNAAIVAVPTLMTAEVLIPARIVVAPSGNSILLRIVPAVIPSERAASFIPRGICASAAYVLRTIGSNAYSASAMNAGTVPMRPVSGIRNASNASEGIVWTMPVVPRITPSLAGHFAQRMT